MKRIITSIAFAMLSVACGAPMEEDYDDTDAGMDGGIPMGDIVRIYEVEPSDDPEGDIGSLEQRLVIPTGYGSEAGSVGRCWSGVNCEHPGTKNYARKFYASTCRSDIQTRFVEAEQKLMTQNPWFPISLGTKNEWRCGSAAKALELGCKGGVAGCAVMTINPQTNKITSADVWIFPENIEGQSGWNNRTIAQQNRYWNNAILHEIYHSQGLEHSDDIHVSELMKDTATESFFTSNLQPTFTERSWLRDYQP